MQLNNILSVLAMAMAINAAPAPDADTAEGPYLKVRDPGCIKRDPSSCGYTYIKKSEVPELISRDTNDVEENFLKVRDPGCIKRDPSCGYVYIKA